MIIAIDYDDTYTAARGLWCAFSGMCRVHGVQLICVTGRGLSHRIEDATLTLPVVYADGRLKRGAAEAAGYKVDIWIDDMPGTVERCKILEWTE